MKRLYFINLFLLLTISIFAGAGKVANLNGVDNEVDSSFINRKEKGFYNIMQVSLLLGNSQFNDRPVYYTPYYMETSSFVAPDPVYYRPYAHTNLTVAPSFTITNGYMFNEHWAAGAGVGFEIFDYNLFPLFAELRYTVWDRKISPFVVIKGGYSFNGFKAKHYDELSLNWSPYYLNDSRLRNYGGFMLHPEVGVKVPLNENCDLLFTAAYRYQKTRSVAKKEYTNGQFDEWEHKEELNRLSFGIAIIFR